ncbi:MAG: TonB-dependent receptor plug domain-containing protein, partial [Verrucomicrobiota bacterium]
MKSRTLCLFFGMTLALWGQNDTPPVDLPETGDVDLEGEDMLETFTILGSAENLAALPASGYLIDAAELRQQNSTNVNKILGRVPGVYVREEDGVGNFPNISIRGADGTRSEKTTVMEDG